MRPSGSLGNNDPKVYVNKLAAKTNATCDFCNFREMTAEDVFERFDGMRTCCVIEYCNFYFAGL